MTDYWKDRRPPAERLPDCERMLKAAQEEIERLGESLYQEQDDAISLYKEMARIAKERDQARAERDDAIKEVDRLQKGIRAAAESVDSYMHALELASAERNELLEMLKETLKYGVSDSRRKEAYDLVVRLGGYQGKKTEGKTDERS